MLARRLLLIVVAALVATASSQAADQPAKVIFVCEHGAAKSIVAAAYFNQMAQERGIKAEAIARGINLDPEISPLATDNLKKEGLTPTESKPTALSQADVDAAQRVVTMCDLPEKFAKNAKVTPWSDVPPFSPDYSKSRKVLRAHIAELLDAMASPSASQRGTAEKR